MRVEPSYDSVTERPLCLNSSSGLARAADAANNRVIDFIALLEVTDLISSKVGGAHGLAHLGKTVGSVGRLVRLCHLQDRARTKAGCLHGHGFTPRGDWNLLTNVQCGVGAALAQHAGQSVYVRGFMGCYYYYH